MQTNREQSGINCQIFRNKSGCFEVLVCLGRKAKVFGKPLALSNLLDRVIWGRNVLKRRVLAFSYRGVNAVFLAEGTKNECYCA